MAVNGEFETNGGDQRSEIHVSWNRRSSTAGLHSSYRRFSLSLNAGDRWLVVGSNAAGKTTILKILGWEHMVEPHMDRVFGRSAFHNTVFASSSDLCYLGGEWRRDVAFRKILRFQFKWMFR